MPETCSRCGYFQCKCGLASYEKYGYMKSPSEKRRDKRRDLVATLQAELQQVNTENEELRVICDCLYNGIDERWSKTEMGQKIIKRYMQALKEDSGAAKT